MYFCSFTLLILICSYQFIVPNAEPIDRYEFNVCEPKYKDSSESIYSTQCASEFPCTFCIQIQDAFRYHHISHLINHVGTRWEKNALKIIDRTSTFKSNYIHDMLVSFRKDVNNTLVFGDLFENINYLSQRVMADQGTCQYPDDTLLVRVSSNDRASDLDVHENLLKQYKKIILSGVGYLGYNHQSSASKDIDENYRWTDDDVIDSYVQLFAMIQLVKSINPSMSITLVNDANIDRQICMYSTTKNVIFLRFSGFESIIGDIRRFIDMPLIVGQLSARTDVCLALANGGSKGSKGISSNAWVQYGRPRTATTLQYQIISLIAIYLCRSAGVRIKYAAHESAIKEITEEIKANPSVMYVVKTHDVDNIKYFPKNSVLFVTETTNKKASSFSNAFDQKVLYAQNYDSVVDRGMGILQDYELLFGLSSDVTRIITEIINNWDILRLCCGPQMSTTWRYQLYQMGGYTLSPAQFDDMAKPGTKSYPNCESHDFGRIEFQYLTLLRLLPGAEEVFNADETRAGVVKVGYCNCTIELTKKDQYTFNDPRYTVC